MYFLNGDFLRISAFCGLASVTLRIRGSFILPDGSRRVIGGELSPTSDRAETTLDIPTAEGVLESLVIEASAGTPVRGQCYVLAEQHRGSVSSGNLVGLVRQGYVSLGSLWAYPTIPSEDSKSGVGALRSITGTNPAAGSEISEAVPTGALWRLITARASLVTDANVATRQVRIAITDGTNTYFMYSARSTQAASLTRQYDIAMTATAHNQEGSEFLTTIPQGLLMPAGHTWGTNTTLIQAGDDWGAPQYLVEEWIQP